MKIKKFRKKPLVVQAYQAKEKMIIQTIEGPLVAQKGDWVVTGIEGEQYPVKKEIFEKIYEAVD